MPNRLIQESSPYLQQHANNPVDWFPWGKEALEKAKNENKLLLISIGYSACHWCHVMEKESFEDAEVAEVMNKNFVCIKIDREERPDIDNVYMLAVQLMTGQGGWPLNCIALPDQRPIYGGTYFPKEHWLGILNSISNLFINEPEKVIEYADQLLTGIKRSEIIPETQEMEAYRETDFLIIYDEWKKQFDPEFGGPARAPKFPMPNNYIFLLRYYQHSQNSDLLKHIELTLDKMAYGGIYDHIGGGFARYSTDVNWKVPHFEKMLYDNAQLISLYSEAWKLLKKPLYKKVVEETFNFIKNEMTSPEGAFYSALDADTEGEEGKFYVWTKEELEKILEPDFPLFSEYFSVNEKGYWEHGNYILLRSEEDDAISQKFNISIEELEKKISGFKSTIYKEREKRMRPGLDDKILASWNGLMIQGLGTAYLAFNDDSYLKTAIKSAHFILTKLRREDGGLNHNYKNNKSAINGYLEDYSFTIESLLTLYECTFDEQWILEAEALMLYVLQHFKSPGPFFYFTSDLDDPLIARKPEIYDNVIPSPNSSIGKCLFLLGHYLGKMEWIDLSKKMALAVKPNIHAYGSSYSNWAILALNQTVQFYEVTIAAGDPHGIKKEILSKYNPFILLAGTSAPSELPILKNRFKNNFNQIFVCSNGRCLAPVGTVEEALTLLE